MKKKKRGKKFLNRVESALQSIGNFRSHSSAYRIQQSNNRKHKYPGMCQSQFWLCPIEGLTHSPLLVPMEGLTHSPLCCVDGIRGRRWLGVWHPFPLLHLPLGGAPQGRAGDSPVSLWSIPRQVLCSLYTSNTIKQW